MTRPDIEELRRLAYSEPEDGMGGDFVLPIEEFRALLAHIEAVEGLVREYGLRHKAECGFDPCDLIRCDCGAIAKAAELGLEVTT